MKPTILLLSILLIASVTAYTVYSGEPIIIQLDEQFEYYTIAGNETEVELDITQDENNNVTIIPNKYMSDDSFEIIFFNPEEKVITVSSGGGGGGGTRTVYKDNITYVPIDNYVTQYVDKEVEVEKEVEVQVEAEKGFPWISVSIIVILVVGIIYLLLREDNTDVRRFK